MSLDIIKKSLLGGNKQDDENKKLIDEITKLKDIILKKDKIITEQSAQIEKKRGTTQSIDIYDIVNLQNFLESGDEVLKNPELFDYEEGITAFDRNIAKNKNYFFKYQEEFIQDWSLSTQETVILYYGVGTGKTNIAVNCAEQFMFLNIDSHVYFLTPASLVFGVIQEMYKRNIDPARKDKNGDYVYNFISYQQLLRSKFDFKPNSLLIIDEVHNLRNFKTKEISAKVSARKYTPTDTYTLVGTKLGIELLNADNKFLRCIFMTGTLFVNSEYDIEPIISLGFKKAPMTDFHKKDLMVINNDVERMKVYYGGLLSFYRKPSDTPNFPKVKYEMIPIVGKKTVKEEDKMKADSFFIYSRNDYNVLKADWIVSFLKKHKDEKTLIYAQFLDRAVSEIAKKLDENGFSYGVISGKLEKSEKMKIVEKYNNNKIKILIFTLAIKEGISFKETNNFILTQPYWNYAITEQIIARALRADSHKAGNKSLVNIYMLAGLDNNDEKTKKFIKYADEIMNNDIKTYNNKPVEVDAEGKVVRTELDDYQMSVGGNRDFNLYIKMFRKQSEINKFELDLLYKVPRFETVNNIENNDFVKLYNEYILLLGIEGETLTNQYKINIKRKLYEEFYRDEIKKVNKRILRFDNDSKYKSNRNPDLEEIVSDTKYKNQVENIKTQLNKGKTLSDIISSFNISKQEITSFQANFTPENEVDRLIAFSNISKDDRKNLLVLEPTCGIANVITGLLKLKNCQNFLIDGVEFHNLFFQIGQAQLDTIDNVKLYNMNIFEYNQKYGYHYILGNPPFNIRTQKQTYNKKLDKVVSIDVHYYDVDFVAYCYNMLKDDGELCMIMSDRFLRDTKIANFKIFNEWMDILRNADENNVQVEAVKDFKKDKTITKAMETNFGMIILKLKKLKYFAINMEKAPPSVDKETRDEIKSIIQKEKRLMKKKIPKIKASK